ncbi:MAG: hypothetical protein HWN68_20270 [Desulfobacterales bacterium]|nr:hypothetical protein [Desulfobacterales bacterium]
MDTKWRNTEGYFGACHGRNSRYDSHLTKSLEIVKRKIQTSSQTFGSLSSINGKLHPCLALGEDHFNQNRINPGPLQFRDGIGELLVALGAYPGFVEGDGLRLIKAQIGGIANVMRGILLLKIRSFY